MGFEEWKFVQMFQVTFPFPYMVKNFKNLLLRNQEADNLETWYTASGTQVLPMFSYGDPGLALTIFYDRVKFISECFCMAKSLYSIEC